MRSSLIVLMVLCFDCMAQTRPIQVTTDASSTYQTMDGFGASDAWRCQFVGKNWPVGKREAIAERLFSQEFDAQGNPKGIGLSIWRFYISAGTTEQGEDSDIGNAWRRGESFQNPDGTYDWQKQAGQQWFLRAAKRHGVERLLAFTIAAPVHMSQNGKGYATKGDIRFNVKPGALPRYSQFLVDVLAHFEDEGIHFDYLSPFNEPQWNWDGPGQEGTPALNEELYAFIKYLSRDLSEKKLSTRMVVGEAGTIGHVAKIMDGDSRDDQANFFFNSASPFYIGNLPNVEPTISAHSYFSVWPVKKQVEYRQLLSQSLQVANPDLGYWQSEYCILQKNGEIGSGGRRDLGMETALYVARIIHNDLTLCHARSWQWWTAISQCDFKDGLVYLDDGSEGGTGEMGSRPESLKHDGVVRDSKLMWVLGNYSLFIRPGMVRIKCSLSDASSQEDGVLMSAWKRSGTGQRVYVATNLSAEDQSIVIQGLDRPTMYVTSSDSDLHRVKVTGSTIRLPARSVATLIAGQK
ncbi:MAG: glycoside hydrolase family 30 protein [Planctomycetes bacterium]|nr:glycoside hydrolase family 30 protein [Planctomycetota bacterium]